VMGAGGIGYVEVEVEVLLAEAVQVGGSDFQSCSLVCGYHVWRYG
jgi:hypothetical protein